MVKKATITTTSDGEALVELLRRVSVETFSQMVNAVGSSLTRDDAKALCAAFREFKQ